MALSDDVAAFAVSHGLGAVGLTGRHANGTAGPFDPVEIFVTVPLDAARDFAEALAESCGVGIHLFDPSKLPWSHPLHYSVTWLNADVLPRIPVPSGAVLSELAGQPVQIHLSDVPHFIESDQARVCPGRPLLVIGGPPIGGFLL